MSPSRFFFSLFDGRQICVAPKTKVIPSADVEKLLNGRQLLTQIQKDAEAYRERVATECEALKEQAQMEGYEEGFKTWAEQVAKLEAEILQLRKEFEKKLSPLALAAAKKILGRELETSPESVTDVVATALRPVATHKKITVYVNQQDFEFLDKNKPKLKELFESLESFSLRPRADVQPGGCVIETEGGIINAQLENQWRTLEKAFDKLMATAK